MSHTDIALQRLEIVLREHFIDKPHSLVGYYFSFGTAGLTDRYAAAFLSPVLQRKKTIIDCRCDLPPLKVINAKDAALLLHACLVKISVDLLIVHKIFPLFKFFSCQQCKRLFIFVNRSGDNLLRQQVLVIRICLEPVSHILLVKRWLSLSCLVSVQRPEA